MFKFLTKKKFTNSLVPGTVALGVTLVGSLAANPAQAGNLSLGQIRFQDSTDDFLNEVDPSDKADMFDVQFNLEAELSPEVAVQLTKGNFAKWLGFDAPPPKFIDLPTVIGQFEWNAELPNGLARYEVKQDFSFDFSGELVADAGISSLKWVIPGGTKFDLTEYRRGQIANFSICEPTDCINAPFWEVDGEFFEATNDMQFFDQQATSGGNYQVSSANTVPEPGTIVGLLTVGSLGLLAKRKKQA